ncbi:MAG: hypothetical protein ACT4N2_01625 [Hyphomicrobium sp.]
MTSDEDNDDGGRIGAPAPVVRFPYSRIAPPGTSEPPKDLGLGTFAQLLGAPREQATGHWCSRCKGIWYGYLLEVTCPVCGNRHG